jgi:acetylxylan esterase
MYYSMSQFAPYADKNGFIVIYPGTPHDMRCWDVATDRSLKHNGGGDSQGLVSMVNYTITKYSADQKRVFVTGGSSGAMMTNVLAGTYPDVFAAGAVYSGGAAGCNAGARGSNPSNFNQACLNGQMKKTPKEWSNLVHGMYPEYNGPRTRMQLWHGTADSVVRIQALGEMIKQWSMVLGVSFTRNVTDNPQRGYTKMIFGDGTKLVAYNAKDVRHIVPMHPKDTLSFFGIL